MKKYRKLLIGWGISCAVVACIVSAVVIQGCQRDKLLYSQEYLAGQGNIKGNVDVEFFLARSEAFAIGANSYGYAVFKDPKAAFEAFTGLYSDGIDWLQNEYGLPPLTETSYEAYMYAAFPTTGDSETAKQVNFIPRFLDIYENSFHMP